METFPSFYHGGTEQVVPELWTLPESVLTAMVLGHNPGWSMMVQELTEQVLELKTADAALLEARKPGSWGTLLGIPHGWRLVDCVRARDCLPE